MNYIQFVIFVILALAVLFGAHYLVYASVINFFSITSSFWKNFLLVVILLLAVSFILSSLLARLFEGMPTRIFYFLSSFWLGLLVNLILAMTAACIILFLGRVISFNFNSAIMGTAFILLAFGYSIYGTWNAFNPQIKNIAATIRGLPPQWQGKKVVQLSDVHLGHINRESFLRRIVEKVNAENPEIVVITGDLFDGMDGNLDAFAGLLNGIRPQKGIFFVTGNHETYLGVEKAREVLEKTKIKILEDEVVDVSGLKLIGINYPGRGETKDPVATVKSLENNFSGQPNILLYHSPVKIDQFKESGVNLQLSGHTHKGQLFPFGFITKLVYEGYDYGLHNLGDYTIYTTSGAGTWGPPMRTGNKPEIAVITLS